MGDWVIAGESDFRNQFKNRGQGVSHSNKSLTQNLKKSRKHGK